MVIKRCRPIDNIIAATKIIPITRCLLMRTMMPAYERNHAIIFFCIPPNTSPRSSGLIPLAHCLLMILKRSSTVAFYTADKISQHSIMVKWGNFSNKAISSILTMLLH